jgi:hypothetical protein
MKKYAVIIGLLFTALVFSACMLKGGTIEVINDSPYNASIAIYQNVVQLSDFETIAPDKRATFLFDENGTYTVNAIFLTDPKLHGSREAVLLGGNTVTVKVRPTN